MESPSKIAVDFMFNFFPCDWHVISHLITIFHAKPRLTFSLSSHIYAGTGVKELVELHMFSGKPEKVK